jgi:ADP-ribosyl-[dinitrogen reductase] hydrolase
VRGACRLLVCIIHRALKGCARDEVVIGDSKSFFGTGKIVAIARAGYQEKAIEDIRGSGYVVKSLEAALWCYTQTNSSKQAILSASNLGEDAHTTTAVCGQVAGAYYGASSIPAGWLELLALRSEILRLADQLFHNQGRSGLTME